jgi:catechol 2,3-dioxygenase-like lactoylglutathione lyase family enzyme
MIELLVNIDVDNLETAAAFYKEAFSLTVGRRFGAFGVELLGASSRLYLLAKEPESQASPTTDQKRFYQPVDEVGRLGLPGAVRAWPGT